MKQLYKAIQELFAQPETLEVFRTLGLTPPEYIDLYNGQPEEPDRFEFTTPSIFLDYSIDWSRSGTTRIGTLTLEAHVLTDPTSETDNLPGTLSGMEKIDYYETISNLLEDLPTSETSGLVLKSERPITTDYFNYHLLTFACTISRRQKSVVENFISKLNIQNVNLM